MRMIANSILIPYTYREGFLEHFSASFPVIRDLVSSIPDPHKLADYPDPCIVFRDIKTNTEVILIGPKARRQDAFNSCLQINVGLKLALGQNIVLLLQDILPTRGSIRELFSYISTYPDRVVYSTIYKKEATGSLIYWVGPERQFVYEETKPDGSVYKHPNPFWGMIAFNKQQISDIGGIDEDFWKEYGWEDDNFLWRAKELFGVEYVDWARGVHLHHGAPPPEGIGGLNNSLYHDKIRSYQLIANEGRVWGLGGANL